MEDNMENTEVTEDTGEEVSTDEVNTEEAQAQEWFFTDGVKGNGEKPEWYNDKKYKSVAEQAKAYPELAKKLGTFTGAPDEYKINVSDMAKEKGFVLDADHPLVEELTTWAKEKQVSQEGLDEIVELYAQSKIADAMADKQRIDTELKELGGKAQKRINDLRSWGEAHLPEDMMDGFCELFSTAKCVEVMEQIIGKTLEKGVAISDGTTATTYTEADVQAMQFAVDEYGNRKMNNPEYRKEYEKISKQVRGTHEARSAIS